MLSACLFACLSGPPVSLLKVDSPLLKFTAEAILGSMRSFCEFWSGRVISGSMRCMYAVFECARFLLNKFDMFCLSACPVPLVLV